jgi:two-component system cell cycle response regulator
MAHRSSGPAAGLPRAGRRTLQGCGLVGVLALAFHLAHGQLGLGGHGFDDFDYNWIYDGVVVGGALSCLARGLLIKEDRLAWLLIGVALAFDAAGELYYTFAFGDSGTPPTPSLADALYLTYYPCAYAGLGMLVRGRIHRLRASTWLDGAIVAMTAASVIATIALGPVFGAAATGNLAVVATNLAYPVGDLILLALATLVVALAGWRPGRGWLMLTGALSLGAVGDIVYLHQSISGGYGVGGILDSLWIASALTMGFAAWQPSRDRNAMRWEGRRLFIVPGACALTALGVLLYSGVHHVSIVGLALAGGSVLIVFARAAWTVHENIVLLDASRHDARTDALTGLGNRRAMTDALDGFFEHESEHAPATLAIFDLDGFKLYNDRFGHIAGDTLLSHLGLRLQESIGGGGAAFRLGGDEFCVLLRCAQASAGRQIAAALTALTAVGDGFSVGASCGTVEIPSEARATTVALRMADDRMYVQKGGRRGSARQQTHDVLLGLLREREPELHSHLTEVGRLATLVGRKLRLGAEQLDELHRAAELHDVGKAAIPDAVLNKPGPLEDHEWDFMRRHTLVGERILAAAPALAPVSVIVRSSHERWDGAGYPDRLAGEQIPIGARIVHVCDAFHAMTSHRPYSAATSAADALAELVRCAGSQFDPTVVDAFVAAWNEHADEPRTELAPAAVAG